jgi:hypothetical protein
VKLRVIAAVAVLGSLAGWATTTDGPFDPAAWAASDYWSGNRNPMADELLRSRALIGRQRAEVVGLLGEPPETSYFSDWDMVYRLGPERGWLSIDSEWLVLRLTNGNVSDARLVRD